MPTLRVSCVVLRLHGVHRSVHRDDVKELEPEALFALAPVLRSYGFDLDRRVDVHQLLEGILLTQSPRHADPGRKVAWPRVH
jgi:hypothetical protein